MDTEKGCEGRYDLEERTALCKKEAKETAFRIRMAVAAVPDLRETGRPLWQEAKELTRIFASIAGPR